MLKSIAILTILLSMQVMTYAEIPYCEGSNISADEGSLLQKLVPAFAKEMKCNIGKNCLSKWDVKSGHAKFSIAWQEQCGPIIEDVYQLGDSGKGSTFVCETNKQGKLCCWPLGYDYNAANVVCAPAEATPAQSGS